MQAARLSRRFFATSFRRNALTYENQKKVKVVESMFQRKQANSFIYLLDSIQMWILLLLLFSAFHLVVHFFENVLEKKDETVGRFATKCTITI